MTWSLTWTRPEAQTKQFTNRVSSCLVAIQAAPFEDYSCHRLHAMDQESLNEMLRIRSLESPEASDPFAKLMLSNSTSRGLTNEGSSPQSIGHNGDRCNSLPDSNIQSGAVIAKIEDIFESMVDCLLGGRNELVISLKSRRTTKDSVTSDSRKISFPGKTQSEAWKFSLWYSSMGCMNSAYSLQLHCFE